MVKAIPEGFHTVTPYLTVKDLPLMLRFVKGAFGATLTETLDDASGQPLHADAIIGDSHVMMGQGRDEWKAMPAQLYLYVEDTDATYQRALAAGGTSLREPTDQFYGDRSGGVVDPCGNYWWIATHIEDVGLAEMQRRAAASMK